MSDTSPGIEPVWDFSDYMLMWEPMACITCGKPTHWAELNFQAPCHPGPCDVQLWQDYYAASRRTDDEALGPYGRCDTCGAPCDDIGCTSDRAHRVAIDPFA